MAFFMSKFPPIFTHKSWIFIGFGCLIKQFWNYKDSSIYCPPSRSIKKLTPVAASGPLARGAGLGPWSRRRHLGCEMGQESSGSIILPNFGNLLFQSDLVLWQLGLAKAHPPPPPPSPPYMQQEWKKGSEDQFWLCGEKVPDGVIVP